MEAAVGGTAAGRRMAEDFTTKKVALKAEIVAISGLVTDIDNTIAQLDRAGTGSDGRRAEAPPSDQGAGTAPSNDEAVPANVVRAAENLSERNDDTEKTEGFVLVAGAILNDDSVCDDDGRLRSRRTEAAREGLRPPWRQTTTMDHVEAQAAALMRRPGAPRAADLVINNDPCRRRPFGCEHILESMLPSGSRLDLYVKKGDSVTFYRRFTGNGEAMAP